MNEEYLKARDKITRLCSRQEKCSSDVKAKLVAWGLPPDQQAELLTFLIENKFVDDKRYAFAFVRHHHRLKKWGKQKIRHALALKKIPETLMQAALKEIPPEEYLQTLMQELKKKRAMLHAKNRFDLLARLQRFALSKGYEPDIIRKVLDDVV